MSEIKKEEPHVEPEIKESEPWYRYCFVPNCKNTNFTAPEKEFLCVPKDAKRRKLWYEAAGCPSRTLKTGHCCEDHFDLKEDLDNYMKFKLMGSRKRMKKEAVPRFFPTVDPLATTDQNAVYVNASNKYSESQEPTLPTNSLTLLDGTPIASSSAEAEYLISSEYLQGTEPCQEGIGVEHKYAEAKPQMLVKTTQTNLKVPTRSIGVTCDIIS